MKNYVLLVFLAVSFACKKQSPNNEIIASKNKTIDSLKVKLEDCKGQAKIMAEVLEKDRIKEKTSH